MKYECSVCGDIVSGDSVTYIDHNEGHIVDLIRSKHPEWTEKNGVCAKCYAYYRDQLKGQ